MESVAPAASWRRRRPPTRTLDWIGRTFGPGARVIGVRPLGLGGWLTTHAVTVVDGGGGRHSVVLRRWARPGWASEDPAFDAAGEARILAALAWHAPSLPAPRLIA